MNRIKILGELTKLGYTKFNKVGDFVHSSLTYQPASFRNLENEPKIYSFTNSSNEIFYMWSFIYDQITNALDFENLEDLINFGDVQFYINSDQFLIPSVETFEHIYSYSEQNTFARPTIHSIDSRLDLGDKTFIVSDAGILFSIYKKLEHKLLDDETILHDKTKIIIEKTIIGTLNSTIHTIACHLIPIDASF